VTINYLAPSGGVVRLPGKFGDMDMFEALKGKRILVTGDTGFKGSWLVLWLLEIGAEVQGYSLPPDNDFTHFRTTGLECLIRHTDGDIRDLEAFYQVMADFQPEIVFHLAAQALVRKSYQEPKNTFDTNIGGSVNILEAVRLTPSVLALVFITSDKCYRNKEWVWGYRENDRLGGQDPYSASKAAAEMVFNAYFESFFLDREQFGAATTRAGNVIGGGDWAQDRIIPDCMRALEDNQEIVLRNPAATRPWQHVLEPLSGYLQLATCLVTKPSRYSGAWNFGPSTRSVRSVGELVQNVIELWGSGSMKIEEEENAPHEANLLQLNTDKAQIEMGWHPHWDAERSIKETVSWYRRTHEGEQPTDVSRAQIKRYMEDFK